MSKTTGYDQLFINEQKKFFFERQKTFLHANLLLTDKNYHYINSFIKKKNYPAETHLQYLNVYQITDSLLAARNEV